MTDKFGSLQQVNLHADDVVIIVRPNKKDGTWDGTYDIIQSIVEPVTLSGNDGYQVAFTALLMALLPSYLREDDDFNDHYIDYIFAMHDDLVSELLTRHNIVGDILNGKLH